MLKALSTQMKLTLSRLIALATCAALLGGALVTPASAQGGAVNRRLVAQAEHYTGDTFRYSGETPRGAHVIARMPPPAEALRAIDQGLTDLFAVARKHGYRARLNYSDYTIFIAKPDRTRDSTGAYSPDVAYVAPSYRGSVFDQGGYIYAAGMTFSFEPPALVVAEHDRDFQHLANVVRYEGEHLVLYHNDRRLFTETADHSRGGGHPILQ
ncbi:MAG: hypothetical protein ACJ74W_21600 [Pyrinomonadaceae bacterium]